MGCNWDTHSEQPLGHVLPAKVSRFQSEACKGVGLVNLRPKGLSHIIGKILFV